MAAHILIIEDNEMSLVLAQYLLGQAGYEVSTASDGGAGLRAALENIADVILCDLDLPTIDGPQLVDALRAEPGWRRVPVLAFTAASMDADQRRALAGQFDGCIVKPIDPPSFASQVGSYVTSGRRASQG